MNRYTNNPIAARYFSEYRMGGTLGLGYPVVLVVSTRLHNRLMVGTFKTLRVVLMEHLYNHIKKELDDTILHIYK